MMLSEWLLPGAIIADVATYVIAVMQLHRGFPERSAEYAVELAVCFIAMAATGFIKGFQSPLWSAVPAAMFGLAIIAGKGSIARLVADARYNDARTAEVEGAQRRFVRLLPAVTCVGAVLAFVGP